MSDVKDAVQRQFGAVAQQYRTSAVHAGGHDLEVMVSSASISSGASVLDVGCGAGHTALAFAPMARHVVAYDLTSAMLEQTRQLAAERHIEAIATIQGDVNRLPFASGAFDLVVSRYSAHHWPNPDIALGECRRVLKRDGAFILSDVVAWENPTLDTFLQTIELIRDVSHVRDYRISEWLILLKEAGFKAEILLQFEVRLDFQAWVRRMATPSSHVAMILSLFDSAPTVVREALQLPSERGETFHFVIPGAVFRAVQR